MPPTIDASLSSRVLFAFLVCAVIAIIVYLIANTTKYNLNGFWSADSEFLEQAGLAACILYLSSGSGYLVIIRDDKHDFINAPIKYTVRSASWFGNDYTVTFDNLDQILSAGEMEHFPKTQTMKIDKEFNKMTLSFTTDVESVDGGTKKEDTVSAIMYKDFQASEYGSKMMSAVSDANLKGSSKDSSSKDNTTEQL